MKTFVISIIFNLVSLGLIAQEIKPKLGLDHIIIWTEKDAPEIKLFEEKGFTISKNKMVHTGMGTGGRYINFYNVYLEFLYLDEQATTDPKFVNILPLRGDRIKDKGKSPFGLGLYMTPYDTTNIPFDAKVIQAPWMKPNTGVYFATSNVKYEQEPLILVVPPYMELPKLNSLADLETKVKDVERRERGRQSLVHANGIQKLTNLKVTCRTNEFSVTVKALKNVENCQIVKGNTHLIEMTFDENRQKKTVDYRPKLPIIVKY